MPENLAMDESSDALLSEENLGRAKQLVDEIQAGNREVVFQLVSEISSARDYDLFQNVGKLTRNLHDTQRERPFREKGKDTTV